MTWYLETAVATGLYGLLAGMLVPAIIGRVPEPEPEPEGPSADEAGGVTSDDPGPGQAHPAQDDQPGPDPMATPVGDKAKERYQDIALLPGLRWKCSLATGVTTAMLGGRVGFGPELSFLLYLAPVGVALAVIDWRTRLLPTKLLAPTYLVVIVLVALAAWTEGDWDPLITAGWGWLVAGGTFFALWFIYPKGMGYGDVRLAGVLGIALGYLGWAELLTGVYAGFLIGGVGGLLLSALRIVDRKAYPFGPFMLVGALVGVMVGPYVAAWYV